MSDYILFPVIKNVSNNITHIVVQNEDAVMRVEICCYDQGFKKLSCFVRNFRLPRQVDELCALLVHDAAYSGTSLPTFREIPLYAA